MSDVGGFLKALLVVDRSQQKALMEAAQTENWWLDKKFLTRAAFRCDQMKTFCFSEEKYCMMYFLKKTCSCFKWLSETRCDPVWSGLCPLQYEICMYSNTYVLFDSACCCRARWALIGALLQRGGADLCEQLVGIRLQLTGQSHKRGGADFHIKEAGLMFSSNQRQSDDVISITALLLALFDNGWLWGLGLIDWIPMIMIIDYWSFFFQSPHESKITVFLIALIIDYWQCLVLVCISCCCMWVWSLLVMRSRNLVIRTPPGWWWLSSHFNFMTDRTDS